MNIDNIKLKISNSKNKKTLPSVKALKYLPKIKNFKTKILELWKRKPVKIGIGVIAVLAIVGVVGALNGWWGGGGRIPSDTFTRGLVGYWTFDEGTGSVAHDSSGMGNDGQVCGTPITYEGETYNTVQIGSQCWMTENLNVGTRIDTCDCGSCTSTCDDNCSTRGCGVNNQDNDSAIEKYCYNDSESYCDTDGGLYQWWEAMDLPYSCSSTDCSGQINAPHQGICPEGWHIPTDDEWYTLTDYLEANSQYWCGGTSTWISKHLASKSLWSYYSCTCCVGDNTSTNNLTGFSVLPAGDRNADGNFDLRGYTGFLWSTSQYSATDAWSRYLVYYNATVHRQNYNKAYGSSVRCVRD